MLFNAKSSPHGKTKRQNRRAAHMERQRAPPKGREAAAYELIPSNCISEMENLEARR